MQAIRIKENEAGQRLDKFLAKYLNQAPKSFFYKMMRKKNIVLNGKKVTGNELLVLGDEVKLFLSDETIEKFQDTKVKVAHTKLDILYEDDNIVLINKPAGMLSQPMDQKKNSLVEYLLGYLMEQGTIDKNSLQTFKPSVCNRLDRNTSGIVAAGKSLVGLQELSRMFKDRSLGKYYLTIVNGVITQNTVIQGYLKKDEKTNTVKILSNPEADASAIETKYEAICNNGTYTLLKVKLVTGKTHQIRAHLASTGHEILGDTKYGNKKQNLMCKTKYGLEHQLLHAYTLQFPKLTGALAHLSKQTFTAPLPALFQKIAVAEGLEENTYYGKK